MKYTKWYMVLCMFGFLIACDKEAPKEEKPEEPKLTTEILTKAGSAQRVWSLFIMEIKYINASGAVDSTYTKGPIYNLATDRQEIRFSIGPDVFTGNDKERTSVLYPVKSALEKVFPSMGNWDLSPDGKKLTVNRYAARPSWVTGGDGGTFEVDYKDDVLPPFPLPKALGLKITQSLPDNRKIEAAFIFAGI